MALLVAQRGTCIRRKVGCVIVDHNHHVMATGYNGVAAGQAHCTDFPCEGANHPPGKGLHLCQAIHAEQNALLQCQNLTHINTVYSTASPCIHCIRLLLNTSTHRIVFIEEYPHLEAKKLWLQANRQWQHKQQLIYD